MLYVGFLTAVFAAYLLWCAIEDARTCMVLRAKHAAGFLAAAALYVRLQGVPAADEFFMLVLQAGVFLLMAGLGLYGPADGFVLGNITILCNAFFGVSGFAAALFTELLAGILFALEDRIGSTKRVFFRNEQTASAFIPYIAISFFITFFCLFLL